MALAFCTGQHVVTLRNRVHGLHYALATFYTKVLQTCSGLKTLHQQTPAAAFRATQLPSEAKTIPHDSCTLVAQQEQQ